ncbi:MAG: MFS transporter [Marinilabiliaceae bacterium]|nr:MFS transporter [Marinilabiliaceae bacterium]
MKKNEKHQIFTTSEIVVNKWNRSQKLVLGIVTVTSFLGTFLVSSINVALPQIEGELHMSAISLSWILTAFLLASAIFLMPLGKWADINGVKNVFRWGIVIFTLTTLFCGLAPTGFFLIIFRFIQGIGGAITASTGAAILVTKFPPAHRGRVLGISVSAVYLGLAMGPFFGGIITQNFGWRSIFFISSALGIIATIITFIFLEKDIITGKREKIGLRGFFVYALALIAIICGSSTIPKFFGWILIALGIVLFVLFFIIEARHARPIIDVKLFTQNKLFAFSNIAALINYTATFAIVFLLSLYLQKVKEFSPQQAGSILLIQPLVMAVCSPLMGRLSDKIEPRFLATSGMSLCFIGLTIFAFINEFTPIFLIITVLILVGLGFSLFSSPNMNTIMSSVSKNQYGMASGIAGTMRVLGQMASMTLVTLFFALSFGKELISDVPKTLFVKVSSLLFALFAAICIVGIRISYQRGKLRGE